MRRTVLDDAEVQEALHEGGRFVLYYYCVSLLFWSFKKPSRVQYLRRHHVQWKGLPVTLSGWSDNPFWRGVPYSLFSLLFGGPLATVGGLWLTWWLLVSNFPHDQEINVLIVVPVFLISIWGLPWGGIYLFSVLVTNCLGGQDVTDEMEALLEEKEDLSEPDLEIGPNGSERSAVTRGDDERSAVTRGDEEPGDSEAIREQVGLNDRTVAR